MNIVNFDGKLIGDYVYSYVVNGTAPCPNDTSIVTISIADCVLAATETNCTNAIDDDGDGLVDCNDPDCLPVIPNSIQNK